MPARMLDLCSLSRSRASKCDDGDHLYDYLRYGYFFCKLGIGNQRTKKNGDRLEKKLDFFFI